MGFYVSFSSSKHHSLEKTENDPHVKVKFAANLLTATGETRRTTTWSMAKEHSDEPTLQEEPTRATERGLVGVVVLVLGFLLF